MKKPVVVLALLLAVLFASAFAQAIPAYYVISGTVVDDPYPLKRASMPIAGAKVYLVNDVAVPLGETAAASQAIIAPPTYSTVIDSATTDGAGAFAFISHPVASYRVSASHADFASNALYIYLRSDTNITIKLVSATATGSVSGTVSLDMGDLAVFVPVANCTVSAYLPSDMPIGILNAGAAGVALPVVPVAYRGVTDVNGSYTISGIPISQNGELAIVYPTKAGFTTPYVDTSLWNTVATPVNLKVKRSFTNVGNRIVNGITFTVGTDKLWYAVGDTLRVRYTIFNGSNTTYSFTGGPCDYNFKLTDAAGSVVYNYLYMRACPMIYVLPTNLAPGQTDTLDFSADYPLPQGYDSLKVTAQLLASDTTKASAMIRFPGTPVVRTAKATVARTSAVTYAPAQQRLTISLSHGQYVNVNAYLLTGEKVEQLSARKFLSAGDHSYSMSRSRARAGVVLLRISGDDFSASKRIELLK
jgi:hypothetical protein